jgi:putative tricarboxylic transport membrane protein
MYRLSGVIVLLLGISSLAYSYSLSLGSLLAPGPGFWPFVCSGVIVLGSVALLITERDSRDYERFTARTGMIVIGLLSLVVFALLFIRIGFIIPGLLTFAFWLRFLGEESWRATLILSVLFTVGFYVLFALVLRVPFPDELLVSLMR